MEQSNGFKEVRDALEIASRIEAMKKYVFDKKHDMQHRVGALTTVNVDEALEYARLERLSVILYQISREPNDPAWTPATAFGRIHSELW